MWDRKTALRRGDAPGSRGVFFLPEGRTYSPPAKRAVVCLRHRALSEGDAASAEAFWTMLHFCGTVIIVHAGDKGSSKQ